MSYSDREWLLRVEEFGWSCYYCGKPLGTSAEKGHPNELTKDHVIPRERGGPDELENLVPACRSCNTMKGPRTADEFMRARPGRCDIKGTFPQTHTFPQLSFTTKGRFVRKKKSTNTIPGVDGQLAIVFPAGDWCALHPESGRTHWGTCWACYSDRCTAAKKPSHFSPGELDEGRQIR
jgi:hypothetical protein